MDNLFLSDKQVGSRYGVGRGTIWRWVKDHGFPRPVNLSPGCTRWPLADLVRWEKDRIGTEDGRAEQT
jgi:prophage regulatory protein